jgi:hypothetical protein
MTDTQPAHPPAPSPEPHSGSGLRLRLWLGCLGGAMVSAAAIWVVFGTRIGPEVSNDPAGLLLWLGGASALGIVTGAALALWLDARILGHLRGLGRGLASGQVHELRGLPAAAGWGELSDLTQQAQQVITARHEAERSSEELRLLERQVGALRDAIERWVANERWEPMRLEEGPLASLAVSLDHGFARAMEVRDQNQEAARMVHVEIEASLADARESVEQAERGFVEATSLITSVRELQRLGAELRGAIEASTLTATASPAFAETLERYRATATEAIEELVGASSESVERLAAGLSHVSEIAALVHTLANRSTLIALNAMVASGRSGTGAAHPEDLPAELKTLATEVRGATERVDALSRDVEREVAAATARMRAVSERVALMLDAAPVPAAGPSAAPSDDVLRLDERVREMIQDATRKAEGLSAAGERASRAAERLLRRLEDESREIEALALRLGAEAEAAPDPQHLPAGAESTGAPRAGTLRLLEQDAVTPAPDLEARDREERP